MPKTLYLGLGGMGGRIVCRMKKQMESLATSNEDLFYVIDTDPDDCDKIYAGTVPYLCLYRDKRLADYVNQYASLGARDWIPTAPFLLHEIGCNAGMRAAAALVFLDAEQNRMLHPLEDLLSLALATENSSFKIVLVTGLAGSTGSGIFLQVALWLRSFLKKKAEIPYKIQGEFIGPEAFCHFAPSQAEIERLRGNAYAAAKELDLICDVAAGKSFPELWENPILEAAVKAHVPLFDSVGIYEAKGRQPLDELNLSIAGSILLRHSAVATASQNTFSYSTDRAACPILTSKSCAHAYHTLCHLAKTPQGEAYVPHIDKRWITLWS